MEQSTVLEPWMNKLLRFAACFNIVAGVGMLIFYSEGFKLLELPKPELDLLVQLIGVLVILFGFGYWFVANRPVENRDLLLLGLLSKACGTILVVYNFIDGKLPWVMLVAVFFADLIYVGPFLMIWRRLTAAANSPG